MCSITDMCFMCTRNNNCSLVNDRIVSQIEYLLPEITIFKLGVPLRICCACEKKLQSFNEFKNFCVGNSLRLEERIKKEQFNKDSTAQFSSSSAMKNENTSVGPNSNMEDILIKEEPCEETSYEREYYNNVVKNMTETDCATDNNENCNINNQICTKYGTEDKSAIPGTSDQQFEEIYIKPEIIEDGSMDFENCDDVLMNETRENNQNALSKSGNTSSLKTNGMSSAGISNLKDINFEVRENVRNSTDIVNFLINKYQFHKLSYEDKLFVKELKQPNRPCSLCPDLSTSLINIGKGRKSCRAFNNTWYDKYNWLVGSKVLTKLFCWPCILFATQGDSVWRKPGYSDLKNLSRSLEKHTKTKDHIASTCKLVLLGKQNIYTDVDSARKIEIQNFNSKVKENREILKRLLDISIFLCTQELSFIDHFKELILLMSKRDNKLKIFLEEDMNNKSGFCGTSKTIHTDLIDCINFVLNKKIDFEINKSPYISWQIDKTTDVSCKSKLSLTLRYVNINSGKVVERFMGFFDVSTKRPADDLFRILKEKINKYDLKNKLIAQTYDGAAIISGELNGLQNKIKAIAPQAIFTHCYSHVLNIVLSNACSTISEVRVFFSCLSAFSAYFSKSTKRTNILDQICGKDSNTTWNFDSRVIFTVHSNKDKLLEVFNFIIHISDFDQQSIREAIGLKSSLHNYKFIFLLEAFKLIFEECEIAFSVLQDKLLDITKVRNLLKCLVTKLQQFKNTDKVFNDIYFNLNFEIPAKRRKTSYPDIHQQLKQLFFEILDKIIAQIDIRFTDLEKLRIFDLLDVTKFSSYAKTFPDHLLQILLQQYNVFENDHLKNELMVVYGDNILENCKTPMEMFQFLFDNNLQICLPEFYKLLSISVVVPITSVSVESFSALERIQNYTRNAIGQNRPTNMAQIAIEKELVKMYSNSEEFYEEIIDYFSQKTNERIPLIYKHT